jgi:hypothetical protein
MNRQHTLGSCLRVIPGFKPEDMHFGKPLHALLSDYDAGLLGITLERDDVQRDVIARQAARGYLRAASKGATSSPVFRLSGNRITCLPGWRN